MDNTKKDNKGKWDMKKNRISGSEEVTVNRKEVVFEYIMPSNAPKLTKEHCNHHRKLELSQDKCKENHI